MDTDKLLEISSELGFEEITKRLQIIAQRQTTQNCPLVLPLVGEFSSGKTTLINSLTDSGALETATKPTTATIYEVHFGSDRCRAEVLGPDGVTTEVQDVTSLKNQDLADSKVVTVFDTSTKVPSSVILVDTPGLSSPDPQHKQTLVSFLPMADALLLVSDINAQVTRSLIDFIKTISLSNRQIFLVLTKTDTKSESEVKASREYAEQTLHIATENIVCVSASEGNVEELLTLLGRIQKEKGHILEKVNTERLKGIVGDMVGRIGELLKMPDDSAKTDELIAEKQRRLSKMKREIENLISSAQEDIKSEQRNASRSFEDNVSERLGTLVAGCSSNFDAEAISAINNTATLVLENYKNEIRRVLRQHTEKHIADDSIQLSILENIDLSSLNVTEHNYNLSLNTVGHEYDSIIATGVKVAAAAALVAIAAPAIAGAGAAGAATTASTATTVSLVDTATDIGGMVYMGKTAKKLQDAKNKVNLISNNLDKINDYEETLRQHTRTPKGIVTSLVGFATDNLVGKPQRRRAIHEYMEEILLPEFNAQIESMTSKVIGIIRQLLNQETEDSINEFIAAIKELQTTKNNEKTEYEKRVSLLKEYKKYLSTI